MYEEELSWTNAERFCQSVGGHLANIHGFGFDCGQKVMETCFRDGLQSIRRAFVGLSDLITLNTFRWSSNNRFLPNFKPPDWLVPRCLSAHVSPKNGSISSLGLCSKKLPYVCQRNKCKSFTTIAI